MKARNLAEWRKRVLERDNYTCQQCGTKDTRLDAHHRKAEAVYPELALEIDNGATLCIKCHRKQPVQGKLFIHCQPFVTKPGYYVYTKKIGGVYKGKISCQIK